MHLRNEFKIGLWSIIALAVLIWGINYLKGINMVHQGQFYYLTSQHVDGLAVSSHVKLNGMKVGIVRSMEYDVQQGTTVILFNIYDDDLRIPLDSRVSVKADLLGTSDIVLQMGEAEACYTPWDTIQSPGMIPGMMDAVGPIVDQMSALMPKLDTLIGGLGVLVNQSQMHESLLQVHTLTVKLNQTVAHLDHLLTSDVPVLMAHATDATANLDSIAIQLKEAELATLVQEATATLQSANTMLAAMQSDTTTVGRLLTTSELHDQLSRAVADVDSLVTDIQRNPKRYIHIKVF